MKKFLVSAGLLALTALPALAQTAPDADVVVVRVAHQFKGRATITTSFGAGATQVKELEVPGLNETKIASVMTEATQQALAPLFEKGYTLKGMSGGDGVTLIVLTKQK